MDETIRGQMRILEDNIKVDIKEMGLSDVDCIQLAHNRRDDVNTVWTGRQKSRGMYPSGD